MEVTRILTFYRIMPLIFQEKMLFVEKRTVYGFIIVSAVY